VKATLLPPTRELALDVIERVRSNFLGYFRFHSVSHLLVKFLAERAKHLWRGNHDEPVEVTRVGKSIQRCGYLGGKTIFSYAMPVSFLYGTAPWADT
jgi:hypothetical protein